MLQSGALGSSPVLPKVSPIVSVASVAATVCASLQICRWEFLAFSGTFKTLLDVHEERDAGRVVFSLIKSSFMKDFEGQWQVTAKLSDVLSTICIKAVMHN